VRNLERRIVRLALSLAVLSLPASAVAQIPNYKALYVFGDSLSDTGNDFIGSKRLGANPAIPPSESPHRTYFQGRFSNGPILFEYFWAQLNGNDGPVMPSLALGHLQPKGAVSFAYGGSGTDAACSPVPGLKCQVEQFAELIQGTKPPKRALYAIFSGSSDVVSAPNPFDPAVIATIVTNVSEAIQRLYDLGARDVMVVNMPNIGASPLVGLPALDLVAQQHNAALAAALGALSASLPELRIIPVDIHSYGEHLVATGAFNFVTTAVPPPISYCLFDGAVPRGINCVDVPTFDVDHSFFFWDALHPTTAAHASSGAFLYQVLSDFFTD
jgi:phospholipase/lecithinase/hemolysin